MKEQTGEETARCSRNNRKLNRCFGEFIPNAINPETLRTEFDRDDDYAKSQYEKGLSVGNNAMVVHIAINRVWSTENKDGSSTFSYEKLGWHRSTRELYLGFLDSGVDIRIY